MADHKQEEHNIKHTEIIHTYLTLSLSLTWDRINFMQHRYVRTVCQDVPLKECECLLRIGEDRGLVVVFDDVGFFF